MTEDSTSGWLLGGGADPEEIAGRYDTWADGYDEDLRSWGYRAPEVVAELILRFHPAATTILDAGCGTGLVGRALRAAGFSGSVHGIDVSDASLLIAGRGGWYETLVTGDLQHRIDWLDNDADVVACVGVMTYLPDVESTWREFVRVARPGGLVVFTQREDLWEERDCAGVIDRMSDEGAWSAVEVTGPEPYLPGNTDGMGPVGVYYVAARVS
ncbi:MAG: methyltransferase domain-containing protein [Acidimicrobiia bacterium]|nr:methyltransferase domain-containing protein [Acidimicrobiia bacterium]